MPFSRNKDEPAFLISLNNPPVNPILAERPLIFFDISGNFKCSTGHDRCPDNCHQVNLIIMNMLRRWELSYSVKESVYAGSEHAQMSYDEAGKVIPSAFTNL